MAKVHRNSLKPGHRVHWYEIIEILGQGGFGITYLALDTNLQQQVAIKEYLPIELAVREGDDSVHPISEDRSSGFVQGLEKFIVEAQTLAQFNHPNVVHGFAVFEANNTAYMVMRYEEGESLQAVLTRRKTLEEAELFQILIPILGGLALVHEAGFIHRDIKPANIFIRRDHSPVLLDFGSARQSLGRHGATLTSLVTPGYAPFEQYYSNSDEQGPWTDIYGLGATLYRAISGVTPIDAIDRSKSIVERSKEHFVSATEIGRKRYSKRFLKAVDRALAFKPQDRPQTLADWLSEFEVPQDLIGSVQTTMRKGSSGKAWRRTLLALYAAVLLAAITITIGVTDSMPDWHGVFERMSSTIPRTSPFEADDELAKRASELQRARGEILAQQAAEEQALLAQAEAFEQARQLLEPPGENALERFTELLARVPDHEEALRGKHRLLVHFLDQAKALTVDKRFDEADGALLRAAVVDPDSTELRLLRVRLKDAEAEVERIAAEEATARAEAEKQRQAQLEIERKERERQAFEAERSRRAEEERRLAEEQRQREETRLAELERLRLQTEAAARAEQEKRARFEKHLASAVAAVSERDKETAVRDFQAALSLYPADQTASGGLRDAERLLHKVCYEVLGRWVYKRLFGTDTLNMKEGGAIDYHSTVSGSGRWECSNPQSRTFRITLTAAGFSNSWNAKLSADGKCLDAAHGGCFERP